MLFLLTIKAFERVDHQILIVVIYKAGFGEPILSCLNNTYLTELNLFKSLDINLKRSVYFQVFFRRLLISPVVFIIGKCTQIDRPLY